MSKKSVVIRTWKIFVPRSRQYEDFSVEAEPVKIYKSEKYCWYLAELPASLFPQPYIVAEGGTGYILGRGTTPEAAISEAKQKASNLWSLGTYILGQQQLLGRFFANQPGFAIPKPEPI